MLEEEFFSWAGANYVFIGVAVAMVAICIYLARNFMKKI